MFRTYPKLCGIIKGTYPFIMVDEYQDTSPLVVKILLENLFAREGHHCIVGFFGDAMQSIYDDGIGNLDEYKHPEGKVYEVKKEQNRRNPQKVIELANKIRFDGLVQRPSEDVTAPNMCDGKPKEGVIKFVYSANEGESLDKVRNYLESKYGWDFSDSQRTKELNLTHNLIAGKAGFSNLMELHNSDGILGYRDKLKKVLDGVDIETEGKTFGEIIEALNVAYRNAGPREKKKVDKVEY